MQQPIVWEAYTDFWYFVNERENIRIKKMNNEPKPWSEDEKFQKWKFCNVFRDYDTQSSFLKGTLGWHRDATLQEKLFNIFVFRAFNLYPTFQLLGWQTDWNEAESIAILQNRPQGTQLTSGAYMIRGAEGLPKEISICQSLTNIWNNLESLTEDVFAESKLETAYNAILSKHFWGWGPFTTYQIVLDLLMLDLFGKKPSDLNTWCAFGPGAKRGLREIWPDIPLRQEWMLEACNYLLLDQVKYRQPHVKELNLQDIEFCLCELQKFRRIKRGGRSKATYNGTN